MSPEIVLNSAWLHVVGDKVDRCVKRICYFGVASFHGKVKLFGLCPAAGCVSLSSRCAGRCFGRWGRIVHGIGRAWLLSVVPDSPPPELLHCGVLTLTELLVVIGPRTAAVILS